MLLNVRLNGTLVQEIGAPRVQVQLPEEGTVTDLISHLCERYPQAAPSLEKAVAFSTGAHLSPDSILTPNQQLALLLPIAGG